MLLIPAVPPTIYPPKRNSAIAEILKSTAPNAIAATVDILRSGGLVAIPTETVYGLAGDATNGAAVAGIFEVKGRPAFNPLICHVSDLAMANNFGKFSALAEKLAKRFWPGPLTLVVPKTQECAAHDLVSAGLDTIAIRAPLGIAGEIIAALGNPLAAPSANRSGRISPTTAEHVAKDLGDDIDLIIDGGACSVGLESTIVKIENERLTLLRPGSISAQDIEAVTGVTVDYISKNSSIEAPGMMSSHYAPNATLILNATEVTAGEALLAFGSNSLPGSELDPHSLNLSVAGDLVEAASNLYDYLRRLDQPDTTCIKVQSIPLVELGEAINDRLSRAAAPRESLQ